MGLLHIAAIFFLRLHEEVSRLFFGTYFVLTFVLLAGNRVVLRTVARSARTHGHNLKVFAVVGSGDLARDVVQTVEEHPEWGFQFAGHILDAQGVGNPRPELVLGTVAQLGQILDDNVIDEVIFAVPRERLSHIEGAFRLCQEQGANARVCLDLFQFGGSHVALGEMDGLPMLAFTRAPTDEVALLFKRAFDLLSSAVAVLLLSPAFIATAIAVKLDSPGPVFFRQTRVGKNGRPFKMLKFRSMHVDAEARLDSLRAQNEASGPVFKMRNDPRVTRVGRFIRRTSLDELPQFLNVLTGEMSIVGPRPPVPAEVKQVPALAAPAPQREAGDHLHLAGERPVQHLLRPVDEARPRVHRHLVALAGHPDLLPHRARRPAVPRRALTHPEGAPGRTARPG